MEDRVNISILNAFYGNMFNQHQKEIMRLYYDCDMSLAEVSDELGITRQGVRESLLRSANKLNEWEDKLKIVAKSNELSEGLEQLLADLPTLSKEDIGEKLEALIRSLKEI